MEIGHSTIDSHYIRSSPDMPVQTSRTDDEPLLRPTSLELHEENKHKKPTHMPKERDADYATSLGTRRRNQVRRDSKAQQFNIDTDILMRTSSKRIVKLSPRRS